jgi:hypothetical protein
MEALQVANTILEQLGGKRFVMMVGARHLVGSANSLTFAFMRNRSRSNRMDIELDLGTDTYTVRFFHIRNSLKGPQMVVDASHDLVHAEDLRGLFERHTKLATSL